MCENDEIAANVVIFNQVENKHETLCRLNGVVAESKRIAGATRIAGGKDISIWKAIFAISKYGV